MFVLRSVEGATGLTSEQIQGAYGDEKTELPEYLVDHRPPAWSKSFEEQKKLVTEQLKQPHEDD
jgi:hypothetical protein